MRHFLNKYFVDRKQNLCRLGLCEVVQMLTDGLCGDKQPQRE